MGNRSLRQKDRILAKRYCPYAVWRKAFFIVRRKIRLKEVFMSANLEAKKQVVEEIKEKIEASKSVVLAVTTSSPCSKSRL